MAHAKRTMDSRAKAESLTRKSRTTQARKDANVKANEARRDLNMGDSTLMDRAYLLSPQPRKSNRGHGSPVRLSQLKRAVARIGKPQKSEA